MATVMDVIKTVLDLANGLGAVCLAEGGDDNPLNPMKAAEMSLANDKELLQVVGLQRDVHEKLTGMFKNLEEMEDLPFFKSLRMSRECFDHLVDRIGPVLLRTMDENHTGGREFIGLRKMVYLGVWYLANTSTYREIANSFGVAQSTAHQAVSMVIEALCTLQDEVICWPSTNEEIFLEEQEFKRFGNIEGTIGAIDGCHISIKGPKASAQQCFLNRNRKHTQNLMAVCNSKMKFIFAYAGCPGSMHDQRVLSRTALWDHINHTEGDHVFPSGHYHILGDSAFQLLEHLLVPFKDNGRLTVEQKRFNHELSLARR